MPDTDYSRLRVGIVGAGLMGRWHAKTVSRIGAKLVSVLDQDLSRAKSLSGELGGEAEIFTNPNDMLDSSKLDIVHICTPVNSHFQLARQLINAGIHLLVEKPLTIAVDETRTLLHAARKQDVKLCPVHQFGFQDGVQNAIAALDSLGELLSVRFTTGSAGGETQSVRALNEIVADIIPHPFSVLQRLRTGISLDTSQWHGLHLRAGELQLIGCADGIAIDFYISMNARPTRCEMELFCSQGRVYLNFFHGYAIVEKGRESRLQKVLQPFKYALKELTFAGSNIAKRGLRGQFAYPGLTGLLDCFYQSVVRGVEPPISTEDTLAIAIARDDLATRFLSDNSTCGTDAHRH